MKVVKPLSQQSLVKPNGCVNCSLLAHKTSPVLRLSVWDHNNKALYNDTKVFLELCQVQKPYYTMLKIIRPIMYRASPSRVEEPSFAPTRMEQTTILSTNNRLPSCQTCLLVGMGNPITQCTDRGKICNIYTATYPVLVLRLHRPISHSNRRIRQFHCYEFQLPNRSLH